MPFQSEKQRRYLHANHPEIAKRWERDYAHGGILDINESEEIIDDGGNEIELTDYNAAFDDPNDLSTGVKSLFRAKDGGKTIKGQEHMLAYITPGEAKTLENLGGQKTMTKEGIPAYPPWDDPGASPGTSHTANQGNQGSDQGHSRFEPGSGYYNEPVTTTTPDQGGHSRFDVGSGYYGEPITKPTPDTGEWSGDVEEEFIGPRWESYNKKEWVNVELLHYEQALATQKKKMKNMGLLKLIPAAVVLIATQNPSLAMKTFSISPNDMLTVIKHSLPVMKAKKDLIAALEDYKGDLLKDVNIHNPNEMVNLEKTTDFTKIMDELKDLTKKSVTEDPKGDGGPELPPQLGGPSTEEMAIEYDWLGAVRERQAQKKAYDEKIEREKLAREDNPIVSGTEMDIIALGNSGGLANLFRVKKQ